MAVAAFIAKAPEISIENGVACVRAIAGDQTLCWHMPLLEFRRGVARAVKQLAEHDASGEVVVFVRHDAREAGDGA